MVPLLRGRMASIRCVRPMSSHLFIYVVDRDFGFAPNPFHGYCTLATCKPPVRAKAQVGDWIMGVGGRRLKATGKCIYLMKVTEVLTFNHYWTDPRFQRKKPLMNGSKVMMVGDNIYHQQPDSETWIQEDSHHSNPDGSVSRTNLITDTSSSNVLISNHFYYFGKAAPEVDLRLVDYKNRRFYDKRSLSNTSVLKFIAEIERCYWDVLNSVVEDPFNFAAASKRVDQATGRIA